MDSSIKDALTWKVLFNLKQNPSDPCQSPDGPVLGLLTICVGVLTMSKKRKNWPLHHTSRQHDCDSMEILWSQSSTLCRHLLTTQCLIQNLWSRPWRSWAASWSWRATWAKRWLWRSWWARCRREASTHLESLKVTTVRSRS